MLDKLAGILGYRREYRRAYEQARNENGTYPPKVWDGVWRRTASLPMSRDLVIMDIEGHAAKSEATVRNSVVETRWVRGWHRE